MSTVQQLGLIGNSVKVQSLPTASAETFGAGNRFYTLIGQQEGYITGHTYHTIVANDVYSWEDIAQAGPQGEDGKDYLIMIKNNVTSSVPKVGNRVYNNWSMDSFSRQVFENDKGFTVMNCTSDKKQYAVIFNCTGVTTTHVGYITYTSVSEITGATGADGKDALLYNDMISVPDGNFVGYQYQISALFSKFNRTPQVGDYMTAIIYNEADKIVYIGTAEVMSLQDSYVNYVKINFATSITGTTVYNNLSDIPVINQDLSASGFTPVSNTYYRHTGTTGTYTQGVIYYYDGTEYKALDGSGGGGISDVKVAGTSVVTNGVANIPPASESEDGVVTTGIQTFKGEKTIQASNNSVPTLTLKPMVPSTGRAGSSMVLGNITSSGNLYNFKISASGINSLSFKHNTSLAQAQFTFSNYNGIPFRISLDDDGTTSGKVNCGSVAQQLYLNSKGGYNAVPTTNGTIMSTPSTWSSGTSGSITLTESGTYQIYMNDGKNNINFGVVYWDGSTDAYTQAVFDSAHSGYFVTIIGGVITAYDLSITGDSTTANTNTIYYRRIGI